MCGIVGIAGDIFAKHERAFAELLILDQLRGYDSVGAVKVGYARHPEVAKSLENPLTFVTSDEYTKMLKGANRVLIGHNRAATQGSVSVENAHPFTHDHITGVHNGTLTYRADLEDHRDFKVDSDNLYYHMAKKGVKDLWTKLYGAASLVWWDAKEQSLNFLRNKERPMYIAYDKEKKVVMWASEMFMLMAAASRNGISLEKAPFATTVDKLYTFQFENYSARKGLVCVEETIPTYSFAPTFFTSRKYSDEGDFTDKNGKPDWLAAGTSIDVMFEDRYIINNQVVFEGFAPLDDRVNITYTLLNTGATPPVDLTNKYKLYKATVNTITYVFRKGAKEWDVRVVGVHDAVKKDGSPKTLEDVDIDRKALEEVDWAPFDKGDTKCEALCTFRKEKNCTLCRRAFKGNAGTWKIGPLRAYHCGWCGSIHRSSDFAYVTKDAEDSYCLDCFPVVIKHLAERDSH